MLMRRKQRKNLDGKRQEGLSRCTLMHGDGRQSTPKGIMNKINIELFLEMILMSNNVQEYKRLIGFQGELMEHLYDDTELLMGMIADYLNGDQIAFFTCDHSNDVEFCLYSLEGNRFEKKMISSGGVVDSLFGLEREILFADEGFPVEVVDFMEEYEIQSAGAVATLAGEIRNTMYAMLIFHRDQEEVYEMSETECMLLNHIQLCMENRIFHEIIAFESEHDLLTKLYNRRSYFRRVNEVYPLLASVGVFYFDINNLKRVNDQFGHDAGDRLLKKAADSIRTICNENIHGYRMGGDEFIVVVMNCTKKDMQRIHQEWVAALEEINRTKDNDKCIVAVGCAFAKGRFHIEEVCQVADKRMYMDKHRKKQNGMG